MSMFFGEYLHILHIYNTILHLSAYFDIVLLFMERFVCNLHAYSAYLRYHIHGIEDTGRSKNASNILDF